ncbi:MAG TPA: HEAT repeat domain-containing protein [Phycisphaerae bacterium]|nr:HEAT repeat domain-containing protein [Phycisphaerae bacterium]
MSSRRLMVLLVACCSSLTCQAPGPKAVKTMPERPEVVAAGEKAEACEATRTPEDWARRALTDAKRVDPQTARLAVSSVATASSRPLLRLDTVLLGNGEWPAAILAYSGLKVRRQDSYLLVESSRADGIKPALRDALPPIHEAIERVRGNLLTQKVAGQRAGMGEIERLIASGSPATLFGPGSGILLDFTEGAVSQTGQALDLAIRGKGLFVLEYPDGQQQRRVYTRDGRLKMRKDGVLVSRMMPWASLVPQIILPPDATQVAVGSGGAVLARSKAVERLGERGRISLAWFEHPERLASPKPGFFIRTPEAGVAMEGSPGEGMFGSLQQGSVEGSNVNAVENWSRLCVLEDARQLMLAMMAELENSSVSAVRPGEGHPLAQAAVRGHGKSSSTILLRAAEARYDATEPTLLTFLRVRGTDVWVGPNGVELQRNPETAASLVQYLKFLRKRLDVLGENIANASRRAGENRTPAAYRRRVVQLRDDGEPEVVEDPSPLRVVMVAGTEADGKGLSQPRYVEQANVDAESEMLESDAVLREYRTIREGLQEMGGDAVPALTDLLRASSLEMQLDAAGALGQIGADASAAVPCLIEAMAGENWELREAATSALERIAPDSDVVTEAIVRTWTGVLRSTNPRRRYEAAATLGRMGERAAGAIVPLVELLDDPTSGAARALGRMGPAAAPAVPALVNALQHCEAHVRQQAADALGRIGAIARPAAPALIQAMRDENAEVRCQAAVALGLIGSNDSGCIAALAALLKDEDPNVRDRVAEALGRLGSSQAEVQGLLETASRAERSQDRIWPAFALALSSRRPASFVLSLGTILLTDERATRLAACEALQRLGPLAQPAVPVLTELLAGRDKAVVAAVIDALGAIGPAAGEAVPRLCVALDDRDPFVRRRAAAALGRMGKAAAVATPALVARLSDESEPVIVACVEALGRIGPQAAESRQALRELQRHRSAAVRRAVTMSLDRIGEADGKSPSATAARKAAPRALAGSAGGAGEP